MSSVMIVGLQVFSVLLRTNTLNNVTQPDQAITLVSDCSAAILTYYCVKKAAIGGLGCVLHPNPSYCHVGNGC